MSSAFGARLRKGLSIFFMAALIALVCVVFLLPLGWMIVDSLETPHQLAMLPPSLVPSPVAWKNYPNALTTLPFGTYLSNSVLYGILATIGTLLTSSLAAYGFAKLRSRHKTFLFSLVMATIFLPYTVTLIPQFVLFKYLGWVNTFKPLIVPAYFGGGPFFIFLFRQFFMTVPDEIFEAAKLDGCGYLRSYWQILIPMTLPAFAAAAVFRFQFAWNDFLGPLVYLNSTVRYTVSLGLAFLVGSPGSTATPWGLLLAASLVCMLPPVILFGFSQRYLLRGVVFSMR
ncbi:MAG TPA: carbohydrate ABC transporter permease [Spirochaetia bacterium]|nr:carbohydrate ABC transporter permease [Spirochaetia bacterium]